MKIFLTISTSVYLLLFLFSTNENVLSRTITTAGQNLTCTMNYDGHLLQESQSVEIKGKLFKVEDCVLQRAYHACGSYLLQMVSLFAELRCHLHRFIQTNIIHPVSIHFSMQFTNRPTLTENNNLTLRIKVKIEIHSNAFFRIFISYG